MKLISITFSRTTCLWISKFKGNESYYSFYNDSDILQPINKSLAEKIFKEPEKLPHYNGKKLTIASTNYSIYSQLSRQDEHGRFSWHSGFELKILFKISNYLGLKPVVTRTAHRDVYYSNGTLKKPGLQSYARKWEVDAAVGGMRYRHRIIGLLEYLQPWEQGCYRYLVPRPKRTSFSFIRFLGVFNVWVWIILFAHIVGVTALIVFFTKLSIYPERHEDNNSTSYSILVVISVLLQVPLARQDWKGPTAIVLFSWVWVVLVMAAAFSGSFGAILIRPIHAKKISTIEEFLENGFTYGSSEYPDFDEELFDIDKVGIWHAKRFRLERSLQDRIDRMKTRKYVVPGESFGKVFYFLEAPIPPESVNQLYEVAENCDQWFFTGPVFPLGSPYVAAINKVALRMRSGGILRKYDYKMLMMDPVLRDYIPENVFIKTREFHSKFSPLSLNSILSAFIMLSVGLAVATITFLVELMVKRK